MQLDMEKLFRDVRAVDTTIVAMDFPFLLGYAFDTRKDGRFSPDSLTSVLMRYCDVVANEANLERVKDMLGRSLKTTDSKEGPLGINNLPSDELCAGRYCVSATIGVTSTKINLRRYGDCLAIKPVNDRDELHEKMTSVLGGLIDRGEALCLSRFMHRYGFTINPTLKRRDSNELALNMETEITTMRRYLPDLQWQNSVGMALALVDDFVEGQKGLRVGSYGDAHVYLRIVYEHSVNDATWRHGLVSGSAGHEIVFRNHAQFLPRLEYFVRTIEPENSWDQAQMGIDYQGEQLLLRDVARMLYAGLYQRGFQSAVNNGNKHWTHFHKQPAKATA